MRLLVTGGAGFIGSNFIHYLLDKYPSYSVVNLDLLTYAGNLANLSDIANHPRYEFVQGDIRDQQTIDTILTQEIDGVINFAAESHVDRSISGPQVFVSTNISGTQVLLDKARKHRIKRFIQVSTDEVYGSLGPYGYFTEETPLSPNSPYAASKAGADLLARSYFYTYGFPVNITRCSNNYGPYQFPEKLIPLIITGALSNERLPVYGDGLNIRDWIHVKDHCSALDMVLHHGIPGEIYNIGGHNEHTNLEIVELILRLLNKPLSLIQHVQDRLGHDRRYAIDAGKIERQLGWHAHYSFNQGLEETVRWYVEHPEWWSRLR